MQPRWHPAPAGPIKRQKRGQAAFLARVYGVVCLLFLRRYNHSKYTVPNHHRIITRALTVHKKQIQSRLLQKTVKFLYTLKKRRPRLVGRGLRVVRAVRSVWAGFAWAILVSGLYVD